MEILVVVLAVAVVFSWWLSRFLVSRMNSKGLDDRLKLEFQSLTQSALKESREELERELLQARLGWVAGTGGEEGAHRPAAL